MEGLLQTTVRSNYHPFELTPLYLTELRLSQFCEKWFLDNEQAAFCKILKGTGWKDPHNVPQQIFDFFLLKVNHFSLIKDIPLKILAIDGNLLDQQLVTTFGQLNLDLLEIELINGIYRDEKNLPNDRSGNRLVPLNWTHFNAKGQTKVKLEMMPNFCESDKSLYVRFEIFRFFAIRLTDTGLCGALRAMRILALEIISKCPRKGHTVLWRTFFQSCIG